MVDVSDVTRQSHQNDDQCRKTADSTGSPSMSKLLMTIRVGLEGSRPTDLRVGM